MESIGYSQSDKENLAMTIGFIGVFIYFLGTFLPFVNDYGERISIFHIFLNGVEVVADEGPGICLLFFPYLLGFYILPINSLYRFVKKEKPVKSTVGTLVAILFLSFLANLGSYVTLSSGSYVMILGAIMMIAGAVMMPKPFKHKQPYYTYSPPPPPPPHSPINRDGSKKLRVSSCPNCGQSKKDNDVCFYCGHRY